MSITQEIRGVWIPNIPHSRALASKTDIAEAMDFLQRMNCNTVFPVVWNQGFTLFRSQVMLDHGFPQIAPFFQPQNFDSLGELTRQAHMRGIAVIPWFEYGFAASAIADGGHIIRQNPHWAALNKAGGIVIHGSLAWMNALDAEVQQFMLDLILEVARNYKVDGIQGDDRLPALPVGGGYDAKTKALFKSQFATNPPQDAQNEQWVQWRADILTEFLAKLKNQVKSVNSNLIVSISPAVYPFCLTNLLQDSKAWVERGLLDFIHPQIYRPSFSSYQGEVSKINSTFSSNQRAKFIPGIAFRANSIDISTQDIVKCVNLNRQSGFQGQVFFHLEGLRKADNQMNEIAIALQTQGGYDQIASLPSPLAIA